MRKKTFFLFFLTFVSFNLLLGQRTISGKIIDTSNEALIGVNILVNGTNIGTTTGLEGDFQLNIPEENSTLLISYVGFESQEVTITTQSFLEIILQQDAELLDEVIVTGVADATPKSKLTFSVTKLTKKALQEVPATSAAGALQGKVAGAYVSQGTGQPGQAPNIQFRGFTSLWVQQQPLVLIDGMIFEGSIADINMEDVESIEVVKGAAGSSLYGSRAANGVIVIKTKRGLENGKSTINYRTEFGFSELSRRMKLSQSHPYELAADWQSETRFTKYEGEEYNEHGQPISGSRIVKEDHYADNPFGLYRDHVSDFYRQASFFTNYFSLGNQMGKTNFLVSWQRHREEGIVPSQEGYTRNNIRFNLDYQISDQLLLSTSNLIINVKDDFGRIDFGQLVQTEPDIDFFAPNEEDGSPFNIDAPRNNFNNPLYELHNEQRNNNRNSVLSVFKLRYDPYAWLSIDAQYSYEKRNNESKDITPKGTLIRGFSLGQAVPGPGSINQTNGEGLAQNFQTTALFRKKWGALDFRSRLSYLYENREEKSFGIFGRGLAFEGITSFNNILEPSSSSREETIRAENIFGIVDVDYQEKYIASALFRRDGSSLFGENERWHNYFRVSGAYRLGLDLNLDWLNELKLRAAYGTAGIRPNFAAQYETYRLGSNGLAVPVSAGNKNLKPSTSKELELGLNIEWLDRFDLELVYARSKVIGFLWPGLQSTALTGFPTQVQNAGNSKSISYEATFGIHWLKKPDLQLSTNFVFSRERSTFTQLSIPPFDHSPSGNGILVEVGELYGNFWGHQFLTSLEQIANQLPEGGNVNDYAINSDGYVILAGTEGTINEAPILLDVDQNGTPDLTVIGDQNADFHLGMLTNFSYKNFSAYMLWDWKQGGEVYFGTGQDLFSNYLAAETDQSQKGNNEKKTIEYYDVLEDRRNTNSHFVRDGSFLKLRELAINYTLNQENLGQWLGKYINSLKISLIGRNLWTISGYPGFDPEVNTGGFGGLNYAVDGFVFPKSRTITGAVHFTF